MTDMPWCITCAKEQDLALMLAKNGKGYVLHHKKIGLIQYIKCKLREHNCYW